MMNRKHKRLVEYFISVGIDDSVAPINDDIISNPIRSLQFVSEKENIPDGYDILDSTITGRDAAVIKKGILNATKYYLCFSRTTNATPFSLLHFDRVKSVDSKIWTRVPGAKILQNNQEYCLSTRLKEGMTPIVDICIISNEAKEECPSEYIKMNWNINGLTFCCRHMPMDALELRYQTCIIDRFPFVDYPNSPLSNTTAVFCQPNGAQILDKPFMPTFLSFVLTDSEGEKMYAVTVTFCDEMSQEMLEKLKRTIESIYTGGFNPKFPENVKTLFYTRSVCILSYYPFFQSFRECLKEIYRVANSPGNVPIERYIINLCCETPLPIANKRSVSLTLAHKPIIFRLPGEDEFHLLDLDLEKLFSCLDISNVILMFRALVSQNFKIVVTSSHVSLITSAMESLVSFLMPFEWQFTYVPVLPYSVFGILEAPLSVLVGMHSSRLRPDLYREDREIVICDLDTNTVHVPSSIQLIDIPNNLLKNLRHNLKHMANAHKVEKYDHTNNALIDSAFAAKLKDDEEIFIASSCRMCFLLFWVRVFGDEYRNYLEFPGETDISSVKDLFKVDEFIASRPKNLKKFWTDLVETQGFERFVADETYPLSEAEARKYQLLFFQRLCKQYREYETIYSKQTQQDVLTRQMIQWAIGIAKDDSKQEEIVKAPKVNKEDLPQEYKYEPTSTFPLINKELCGKYGKDPTSSLEDEKENDDKKDGYSLTVTDTDAMKGDYKLMKAGIHKIKSNKDRAVFLLKQVYGAWFTSHVAYLDFKDVAATQVDSIVEKTLEILYKMPDDGKITKDVAIVPDELIFKACLVLCGKFGKDKEAKRIFKTLKASGINPSKTTYGAYTNALASSGANALLSSLGSESSGHSSRLPSFDHRRSFVPSFTGRSLSVNPPGTGTSAPNSTAKRLNQSNVDTIKEDEENNDTNTATTTKPPSLITHAKSVPPDNDTMTTPTPDSTNATENTGNINNDSNNNNNEDDKEEKSSKIENEEEKKYDDKYSSNPNSARNSLTSAQIAAGVGRRIEEMIDYSSIQVNVSQTCECGYVLSEAHVMAGWALNFESDEIECVVCHEHRFLPKMKIIYQATQMTPSDEELFKVEKKEISVTYLSPLSLRKVVNSIISNHRRDLEDNERFRMKHRDVFWNLLWYLYNRELDLTFLVNESDAQSVNISICPMDESKTKYPLNDNELIDHLSDIIKDANAGRLKDAINTWLTLRSQTNVNERENSVWNLPIFDAFTVLQIPMKYKSTKEFVARFKEACKHTKMIKPKMQDRAPSEEVLVYRKIFRHAQMRIPRLTEALKKGKVTRPLSARPSGALPSPANGNHFNEANNNENGNANHNGNDNNNNNNNNNNNSNNNSNNNNNDNNSNNNKDSNNGNNNGNKQLQPSAT